MVTQRGAYIIITLGRVGTQALQAIGIEADDKQNILYTGSSYRYYYQVQVATVCDALEEKFQRNESPFEVDDIYNEKEVFVKDT